MSISTIKLLKGSNVVASLLFDLEIQPFLKQISPHILNCHKLRSKRPNSWNWVAYSMTDILPCSSQKLTDKWEAWGISVFRARQYVCYGVYSSVPRVRKFCGTELGNLWLLSVWGEMVESPNQAAAGLLGYSFKVLPWVLGICCYRIQHPARILDHLQDRFVGVEGSKDRTLSWKKFTCLHIMFGVGLPS